MKKTRRTNHMEEAIKELKIEEIKEKPIKEIKVRDYMDTARELTGFVRENYITGFELGLHLWEENLKIINSQIDRWISVQEEYTNLIKDIFDRLPNKEVTFWNGDSKLASAHIEKMISSQKDYSNIVMNTSDRFMKEAFALMKKVIERTFPSS
jgi:hypothetical protein